MIRGALATATPAQVQVVGEVSNLSRRAHWFFSIKDERATLRCVCFASVARRIRADVADGMRVIVTGRLDFYDAQGQVQLYADRVEPVGQGELERRFRQLCEQLRGLGYFDDGRKKPLPAFAQRVAVVTSRSGAALQDVINTARRRWPGCALLLVDVRVQGDRAAGQIAAAIATLSREGARHGIDAILLTRGGGSIEDLWPFNGRVVADALFACAVPVVAAIGHETDTTIAELVADVRCATPTQAAMTLVPDAAALLMQVDQYDRRLALQARRCLESAAHRLLAVRRHPLFASPAALAASGRQRAERLAERLGRAMAERRHQALHRLAALRQALAALEPAGRLALARTRLAQDRSRLVHAQTQSLRARNAALAALARQLGAVGPTRVLARGYSYTLDERGAIVRSVRQVGIDDRITTVLADGRLRSRVIDGAEGASAPPAAQRRKATRQATAGPDQLDLFDGPGR